MPFAIIVTSSSSECKQSKWDTVLICEDLVIYVSICRVRNTITYVLSWQTVYVCAHSSIILVFISLFEPHCFAMLETNTRINLLWVHKTVRHWSSYIILYMMHDYVLRIWIVLVIITWLCDILALVWHFGPACVTFRPGLCDILALSCVTKASACHHTPILTTGAVYRKFHRSSVSKTT